MNFNIHYSQDSYVAAISGMLGGYVFIVIDGVRVQPILNFVIIDFVLKAAQAAAFAGISAGSGLFVKEVYPHISRYIRSWFKKKNNKKRS